MAAKNVYGEVMKTNDKWVDVACEGFFLLGVMVNAIVRFVLPYVAIGLILYLIFR